MKDFLAKRKMQEWNGGLGGGRDEIIWNKLRFKDALLFRKSVSVHGVVVVFSDAV